jgi:hypothetical protein
MDSFQVNDTHLPVAAPSPYGVPTAEKKRPIWRYIGAVSVASFVLGTLCGYVALKNGTVVEEEDDLNSELNLGLDTLLTWFPEKNAELKGNKGKQQDIIFHMMNFTDESDDPELSTLVIDTSGADDAKTQQVAVLDRRLQTKDKCKDAVLDFILAFAGWLKSFVKFSVTSENELREKMISWLDTNVVGPTAFQKFISKIIDFAYSPKPKDKLKALWAIVKDAWKRGGGWLKEIFKLTVDHAVDGKWPKTKTLVKLAAQVAIWVKKGHSEFVGAATLQYLSTESMIKSSKKLKACRNMTIFS